MASNRKMFSTSCEKWKSLKQEKAYSMPSPDGAVAVFCAILKPDPFEDVGEKKHAHKESKIFRNEAATIAERLGGVGLAAEVIYNPDFVDFKRVIGDEYFHSIITIGHGTFTEYELSGEQEKYGAEDCIDWTDVSESSTHLKTGVFLQRHCGHFSRSFNLPLGTFAVSQHESVIAPVGNYFDPRGLEHPDNDYLRPALKDVPLDYDHIKSKFPKA